MTIPHKVNLKGAKNIFLLSLIFLGIGCSTNKPQKPALTERKMLSAITIKPSTPLEFQPFQSQIFDLIHTQLILDPQIENHTLMAEEMLWVKPHFYNQDTLMLDAKFLKIFSVSEIENKYQVNKKMILNDKRSLNFYQDSMHLYIMLNKKYSKNDTLGIKIKYKATPDDANVKGSEAIKDARGMYFITPNEYMPYEVSQVWTQGETEASSCWFPTLDAPNQKTTHYICIYRNEKNKSLSNGELLQTEKKDENTEIDHWCMSQPISPYLFMIAVGDFEKINDTKVDNKEVSYYVDPAYKNIAQKIFQNTPEMISFFSEYNKVPYPWNKYSQIIAHQYVSGAMENTSATLLGDFVQKNQRELLDNTNDGIVSHELYHQWFGDYVTCKSWSNLTLNESFATLGELLWTEYKYGKLAAQKLWLEDFRRYVSARKKIDPPLYRHYYKDKEELFDRVTYQKGACILNMLRYNIGEDAFRDGLKNYLQNNAYKNAEVSDLRKSFETVTGKDLKMFFNQWYDKGNLPFLKIKIDYNDTTKVANLSIEQSKADTVGLYNFDTEIWVYKSTGIEKIPITINDVLYTKSIPYNNDSKPLIVVDGANVLVAQKSYDQDEDYWIKLYKLSNNYYDKYVASDFLEDKQKNITVKELFLKDCMSSSDVLSELASDKIKLKDLLPEEKEMLKNRIFDRTISTKTRANLLARFGEEKNANDLPIYEKLLSDSSYIVAATALDNIFDIDSSKAYTLAIAQSKDAYSFMKTEVLKIVSKFKYEKDSTLFNSFMNRKGAMNCFL